MINNLNEIINNLDLLKHPEGGYFKETYRSTENYLFENNKERSYSTQILYLVPSGVFSKIHRIKSDETWHFYYGSQYNLIIFDKQLNFEEVILSNLINSGYYFQYTVKKDMWFCGYCKEENSFSLMGCSVSPGFDFDDFEMIDENTKSILNKKYGNKFINFY